MKSPKLNGGKTPVTNKAGIHLGSFEDAARHINKRNATTANNQSPLKVHFNSINSPKSDKDKDSISMNFKQGHKSRKANISHMSVDFKPDAISAQ